MENDETKDQQQETAQERYNKLVEHLNNIRSRGVALAYIILRDLVDAEETFKEVTLAAATMQDRGAPELDNFESWFWNTIGTILERKVADIEHPGLLQGEHTTGDIVEKFRTTEMPPRIGYKLLIRSTSQVGGDPLVVFRMRFFEGKDCKAISEETDHSHKKTYEYLSEAKRHIEAGCGIVIPEHVSEDEPPGESLLVTAEKFLFGALDEDEKRDFEEAALQNAETFATLSQVAFRETRLRRVARYLGTAGRLVDKKEKISDAISTISKGDTKAGHHSSRTVHTTKRAVRKSQRKIWIVVIALTAVLLMAALLTIMILVMESQDGSGEVEDLKNIDGPSLKIKEIEGEPESPGTE